MSIHQRIVDHPEFVRLVTEHVHHGLAEKQARQAAYSIVLDMLVTESDWEAEPNRLAWLRFPSTKLGRLLAHTSLTVCTAGLWIPIWLIHTLLAARKRQRRASGLLPLDEAPLLHPDPLPE